MGHNYMSVPPLPQARSSAIGFFSEHADGEGRGATTDPRVAIDHNYNYIGHNYIVMAEGLRQTPRG